MDEQSYNPRLAALLAVHLVSQVLDEAYVIANAARESGQPWHYLSVMKNLKVNKGEVEDEEFSYNIIPNDDNDDDLRDKLDIATNIVVTSTPQKNTDEVVKIKKMETNFIGQGDEEYIHCNELTKSTSMFINHLFDMSEVEHMSMPDEDELSIKNFKPDLLIEDISKIIESYINVALNIGFTGKYQDNITQMTANTSSSTTYSSYSFLSDVCLNNKDNEVAIFTDDSNNDKIQELGLELNEDVEKTNVQCIKEDGKNTLSFENAYLTLNRDYEQCSEEDGDPVLQDPKALTLQEVELMTVHTSEVDLFPYKKSIQKSKVLKAISAAPASVSGSRKSSLVHRCRTQGARLLACLRGWWRRKTPGKRKESRGPLRGLCPLSPDARRRTASLLDQSRMRSPSPSRAVVWKFNTVNETLVNSSRWKEYPFDIRPDECGEYN
ncbi:uncharacterized protein LOC113519025 isoform X2 [Galleria mellonella]|nr:uncharacterized protein LOC113519025 isoform X2 [Galleria mellonella]